MSALDRSKDNEIRALATEIGAWAALEAGNRASAQQILGEFPRGLEPSGHLRAFLTAATPADQVNATVDAWLDHHFLSAPDLRPPAPRRRLGRPRRRPAGRLPGRRRRAGPHGPPARPVLGGQFDASAKLGEAMLGMGTTEPIVAYNTACAHARAGRLDRAFAWLDRAIDLGFRSRQSWPSDPDLATVRADPPLRPAPQPHRGRRLTPAAGGAESRGVKGLRQGEQGFQLGIGHHSSAS